MIHGEIKVNDNTIMEYKVTNKGDRMNAMIAYEFWVRGRDIHGYPYEYEWEEEVSMLSNSAQELVVLCCDYTKFKLTGWA